MTTGGRRCLGPRGTYRGWDAARGRGDGGDAEGAAVGVQIPLVAPRDPPKHLNQRVNGPAQTGALAQSQVIAWTYRKN